MHLGIKDKIKKFFLPYHERSGEHYLQYLRNNGVKVGKNCFVVDPRDIKIDVSIPDLLSIGDNVRLHKGLVIMTHDWAGWVLKNKYSDFVPSHAPVRIGNNVWFGMRVTVLKGVTIGDNVIIGAGSIVTKSIPSNSVAVGCPAKVVCSIDEYYRRRRVESYEESINYALEIMANGREPKVEEFFDDYPAFVDGSNYKEYSFNYNRHFTPEQFQEWIKNHKAPYHGFEEFMIEVRRRQKELTETSEPDK